VLDPPFVHIDRPDDDVEDKIEKRVTEFGGTFAGTSKRDYDGA
jgi:hypothetical protein